MKSVEAILVGVRSGDEQSGMGAIACQANQLERMNQLKLLVRAEIRGNGCVPGCDRLTPSSKPKYLDLAEYATS